MAVSNDILNCPDLNVYLGRMKSRKTESKSEKPNKDCLDVDDEELKFFEQIPNLTSSFDIIRFYFKWVLLVVVLILLLEKVSKKYSNEEKPIQTTSERSSLPKMGLEKNLTFFCDKKINLQENNQDAMILLLRKDILHLKQLIDKLEEHLRERRRSECMTRKELSRIEDRVQKYLTESDMIDQKIVKSLHIYEADKVAMFDYAASYAGGEIITVIDAIPVPTNKITQLLGFFKLARHSSPNQILNPSCLPGECFKFFGSKARIVIKLGKPIEIGSVSLEHSFLDENISSAPREFQVFSLVNPDERSGDFLGNFTYEIKNKESLQTFEISNKSSQKQQFVMLNILSNHGHDEYTSIYRFRVHS